MKICFFYLLIFLAVTFAQKDNQVRACGEIIPSPKVVNLENPFTAYCILQENEKCYAEDAKNVIWRVKGIKVPEAQYKVLNRTVSSVTFENASSLVNPLTCNVLLSGQLEQTLYGIFFNLGLPPDKPTNLSCIVYNKEKLTCTWDPGRPTHLITNYTLTHRWVNQRNTDCIAKDSNNSCTILNSGFSFYVDTIFQVEATNELGRETSEELKIDPANIIKPNPPKIDKLISAVELQNALKITWENPLEPPLDQKYNIRYRPSKSSVWELVPPEDTATHRKFFTLQDLLPYTLYEVSLRCMLSNGKGFWSDWSEEKMMMTPEAKPSKGPDLWRKIGNPDSDGNREVSIMWKDLDQSSANGKILLYSITFQSGSQMEKFNVTGTSYTRMLSKDMYLITVTASNSFFMSPPSRLPIPRSANYQVLPSELDVKAFTKDNQLWVEWISPNKPLDGYVIEWCNKYAKEGCISHWQREPPATNGSFLRVPSEGPSVHTKQVEKYKAVLQWTPVPFDTQNGFIKYYTLAYKPSNGNETVVTIDASSTEYTLSELAANTLYSVKVMAHTEKGGKDGLAFTFSTRKFASGEVEVIVVASCIVFFILMLLGVLVFFNKIDLIKKHIWPNVPDPSKSNIAQWSPETPSRHDFNPKGHPFQDGSFTDVSVVEIAAENPKSYSEQDLKSMDPLKKNTSEGLSSGIGGSSCLSSPRLSVSDSDEVESAQTTSSTVQYSTVIISGYRDQQPTAIVPHVFSRSESTQPLLDSEERPEEQQATDKEENSVVANQYFKQNCSQEDCTSDFKTLPQKTFPGHTREHLSDPDFFSELERGLPVGQNGCSDGQSSDTQTQGEFKSYLPQTVRRGGYIPQ
ncbi:hypothetical protein GDO86_002402 [Hymenochirus boettgeri]|uniref:Interleukin-6 receptor subunit beta n=1 Tax=Hymenochirus boettgeri TaxID=247094 RepID=A0A8T2KI95_9PIPI|nr:hypothetical protein GDO86_002402 [Hymenochirus boettgeri]